MSTPAAHAALVAEIRERFEAAQVDVSEIGKGNQNSYGAGYALGYHDAFGELLEFITGDRTNG